MNKQYYNRVRRKIDDFETDELFLNRKCEMNYMVESVKAPVGLFSGKEQINERWNIWQQLKSNNVTESISN